MEGIGAAFMHEGAESTGIGAMRGEIAGWGPQVVAYDWAPLGRRRVS